MPVLLELIGRAWNQFVAAVGTTTLGFVIALIVLPMFLHLFKVWRRSAALNLSDFMGTIFITAVVYGAIFLLVLIFGVPKKIRD